MGSELASEIASADRVDLLCAFIKFTGLRPIEKELRHLRAHQVPFRVITSTYMGATERRAVDRLVDEFGAQVKIHFESRTTRLHAKAWLFHRNSGFHSAYVGSSNLSVSALLDGLEWNVRLTSAGTGHLLEKFATTFESYWDDPAFETYGNNDGERLDEALAIAGGQRSSARVLNLSGLRHRPYPYQQEMLETLAAEREIHDRHRNLVVAATGTGKTVVAAFDYRNLSEVSSEPPTLLFMAHRMEILEQARKAFREILGDGNFGELLGQGHEPRRWKHVFATVQSLSTRSDALRPDLFDIVIVDEFHHAHASTYRRVLTHFTPQELVGLTATPERADGVSVQDEFFGGRVAVELRLWDALAADLLAPFHYFGIADATDLRSVTYSRGSYARDQLEKLFTGHDARTRIIVKAVRDHVSDPLQMQALGFCVGVDHARYMATKFTEAGIPSRAVTGDSSPEERTAAVRALTSGQINAIFTADLYNEGIDIPSVDVVLFLRPTDSPTVFLQQLGRGLRCHPQKAVLTALDFVGHQQRGFRLDQRFTAMTGLTAPEIAGQIGQGFPALPAGSQIILDEFTQEQVMAAVKSALGLRGKALVAAVATSSAPSLRTLAEELGLPPEQIIKNSSWTELQQKAGRTPAVSVNADDLDLLKRRHTFFTVDDPQRQHAYRQWLSPNPPHYESASPEMQRYGRMLHAMIWRSGGRTTWAEGLRLLSQHRAACGELLEILDIAEDRIHHVPRPLPGRLAGTGLMSHATYTREEILAALDYVREASQVISHREGVLWSEPWQTDALLVTLKKSAQRFTPSTMYRDYALSPRRFHWESQSTTPETSPTGQRYIHHEALGSSVLLFMRASNAKNQYGHTPAFQLLGTVRYVDHTGSRPMAVTWELDRPMPAETHLAARAVA